MYVLINFRIKILSKYIFMSVEDHELPLADIDEQVHQSPRKIEIGADGLPISIIQEGDTELPEESKNLEKPAHIEEEEEKEQPLQPLTRRFATVMNLLNSLLGAGILSVPNSFTNLGIIPSIILLVLMAALSYVGTVMTVYLQHDLNAEGFPDLAFRLMGRPGALGLAIMSLFFLMSCQLSYLVLGADMITSWFAIGGIDMTSLWRRAILVFVYAMVIPIALSIPRNKSYLKYISTSTVFLILFFDISMMVKGGMKIHASGIEPSVKIAQIDLKVFSSLSIYGLSFALPVVVLPVITQYNPNLKKRNIVSVAAVVLCFTLVFIPGIFGYLSFGADTKPNIVQNFPDKDILMILVRVAFLFVVSFAYVAISNNTVISWSEIIFKDSQPNLMRPWKRAVCLVITNIIPLLIAMFLANAKPALAIGGAMGGCMADFFFPSIMWIIHSENRWFHWKNILCIIFAAFGLITAAISTYQAVLDAIDAFSNLKM
ncbi:Transmembrane amino acid transporter protein [Tritrichomonas foetus]|uniref:Transmembrane amino acid transporter protein n=1 Tax=Tritrichomonas foetus TaxID=1144522 RepID=A0A1J4L1V6_9EUKA|nr:Transmembrane amino acid transporter protein [Tritrichomonas foetus]|eukprot:OHT17497.1 Transmembrane amino acid transporter protein [Tritrichomonas foetus]